MTRADRRCLLQRLAFSKLRHFSWDNFPTNTVAYDNLATRDPDFLQVALNSLVSLFKRVGLETNIKKMQAMICTPGRISNQLSTDSYRRRHGYGMQTRAQWDARKVKCRQRHAIVNASSLSRHLADLHEVYKQTMVAEELPDD